MYFLGIQELYHKRIASKLSWWRAIISYKYNFTYSEWILHNIMIKRLMKWQKNEVNCTCKDLKLLNHIKFSINKIWKLTNVNIFLEALSKSSLHSYYIAVIVCNKYLTVKRLFRWQATDNGLVLRGSGGCSKLSFLKMQYRFLEDFFVFERIFLNYAHFRK